MLLCKFVISSITYVVELQHVFFIFPAASNNKTPTTYLRSSSHHQPDVVKVSSPKLSEWVKLEHVLDEKNRENEQLKTRLRHNAKGFEALAVTVNHYAKKVGLSNDILTIAAMVYH